MLNIIVNFVRKMSSSESPLDILAGLSQSVVKGRMRYSDGFTYDGFLKGNIRHGYGKISSNDSNYVYQGMWIDNKKNGRGTCSYIKNNKKNIYRGLWKDNKPDGYGVLANTILPPVVI